MTDMAPLNIATGAPAFDTVEEALAYAEAAGVRIRVHYGGQTKTSPDRKPGEDWGDVYDVTGYVGRSMGAGPNPQRVRLLVHNRSSTGGGALMQDCIVRVRYANRREGGDLYRHPQYLPPSRWDSFPGDLAAHRRDWARTFEADPRNFQGLQLDMVTATLREHGIRYELSADADDGSITVTPLPDGVRTGEHRAVKIARHRGRLSFADDASDAELFPVVFGPDGLPYSPNGMAGGGGRRRQSSTTTDLEEGSDDA